MTSGIVVHAFVTEEPVQVKLRCVTSPDKGRGMASQCDIPEATLVHIEEPYAMVYTSNIMNSLILF